MNWNWWDMQVYLNKLVGQYDPNLFVSSYLSPFHHSLDTIQLVPSSFVVKANRNESMNTRVWSPIPVIKEAISVYLSVHTSAKSVSRYPWYEDMYLLLCVILAPLL